MSTEALRAPPAPQAAGQGTGGAWQVTGHGRGGPALKRIVVGYGFWIFLLSDVIMFATLFATYAVLATNTAGGPTARQLFDLPNVAVETACLLASSFTCGMASLAVGQRNLRWTQIALLATGLLGLAFLLLELREFYGLVARGAGRLRICLHSIASAWRGRLRRQGCRWFRPLGMKRILRLRILLPICARLRLRRRRS